MHKRRHRDIPDTSRSLTFIELKSEDCFKLNPSPIIVLIPVSHWMADDIVKTYLM